jgi:hypothetical protein
MTYGEVKIKFDLWLEAWNRHDLQGVMEWMDDLVVFEHWTGSLVSGKNLLKKAWTPWFSNHEGFFFTTEDFFFDETEQKLTFLWQLDWLSKQKGYEGSPEKRRGVDILFFRNGKIIRKVSYSKTLVIINNKSVTG